MLILIPFLKQLAGDQQIFGKEGVKVQSLLRRKFFRLFGFLHIRFAAGVITQELPENQIVGKRRRQRDLAPHLFLQNLEDFCLSRIQVLSLRQPRKSFV